jgi:hypothetical protein
MVEEVKGAPEPPVGSSGDMEEARSRRDADGGHGGHQLDRQLRNIDKPGPIFRNHHENSIASKRSAPDRGPRQEK